MLVKHAEYPVIGPALSQIDEDVNWAELAQFIAARRAAGEEITAETFRRNVPRRLAPNIEAFLDRFEDELGPDFRFAFDEWRATTVDTEFLQGFARVWERPFDRPPALLVGRRRELVELVLETRSSRCRGDRSCSSENRASERRRWRAPPSNACPAASSSSRRRPRRSTPEPSTSASSRRRSPRSSRT